LERLWPALRDQFPAQADVSDATAEPQSRAVAAGSVIRERLRVEWRLPQLPPPPQPVVLPISAYEPAPTDAGDRTLADRAVCEVLRSCARRRRLPDRDAAALKRQLLTRLQRLGCPPEAMAGSVAEGLAVLLICLDDARLQWIFAGLSTSEAHAEVPLALTGMFEGRLTSVRADLSFTDAAGSRWLIDIAPQPATQAALPAAFGLRLARLGHLAQALDGVPPRAAVYLPATQFFWEPSP